jgi:hypothetical protein
MASTKTRVCCGKRIWKLLLLHLPANTVIIIIICGNIGRLVNKFSCVVTGCLYIGRGIDMTYDKYKPH